MKKCYSHSCALNLITLNRIEGEKLFKALRMTFGHLRQET